MRPRMVQQGRLVGYAVAAQGDVDADGQPVWFGGRRLSHDLSLPALLARWQTATESAEATAPPHAEVSVGWNEPAAAVAAATRAVAQARAALRDGDPAVGAWIAHATADLLTALCTVTSQTPGSPPPPVWLASDEFDRAARTPHLRQLERQPGRCAPAARELRRAAWRLAAIRLPRHRRDDTGTGELMMAIAVLIAEIAQYHQARRHHAQAAAAHRACRVLPRHRTRPDRVQPDRAGQTRPGGDARGRRGPPGTPAPVVRPTSASRCYAGWLAHRRAALTDTSSGSSASPAEHRTREEPLTGSRGIATAPEQAGRGERRAATVLVLGRR